ncbi:unnamed protein product [Amoebophrya sp. A120]|nr:unnamed protein product [Amoebophrya sp. A120]|eukprot:GSA120T00016274001.1
MCWHLQQIHRSPHRRVRMHCAGFLFGGAFGSLVTAAHESRSRGNILRRGRTTTGTTSSARVGAAAPAVVSPAAPEHNSPMASEHSTRRRTKKSFLQKLLEKKTRIEVDAGQQHRTSAGQNSRDAQSCCADERGVGAVATVEGRKTTSAGDPCSGENENAQTTPDRDNTLLGTSSSTAQNKTAGTSTSANADASSRTGGLAAGGGGSPVGAAVPPLGKQASGTENETPGTSSTTVPVRKPGTTQRDCSGKDKVWTVHYMPWMLPQCVDYDHWCQGTSWYKPKLDAICDEGDIISSGTSTSRTTSAEQNGNGKQTNPSTRPKLLRNDEDKEWLCAKSGEDENDAQENSIDKDGKNLSGIYRIPTKCPPCDGTQASCLAEEGDRDNFSGAGRTPYHIEAQMQLIHDSCIDAIWIDYQWLNWNGAIEFVITILEKMHQRGDTLKFAILLDPNASQGALWKQAHDAAQSPFTTRWVNHELYHTWKGKRLVPVFAVNLVNEVVSPDQIVPDAIYFHDSQGQNYQASIRGGAHFSGTYPWPCGSHGNNLQYLRDRYSECRHQNHDKSRTDMPCVGLLYPQFCDCYKDRSFCCHGYCEVPGKMTENCLFATASFLSGELKHEGTGVDIVQIVTWNDYGEMTHIEPSTLRGLEEGQFGCENGGLLPSVCRSRFDKAGGYNAWRDMVENRLGHNNPDEPVSSAQTLLRVRNVIRNQNDKYTVWR